MTPRTCSGSTPMSGLTDGMRRIATGALASALLASARALRREGWLTVEDEREIVSEARARAP